MDEALTDDELTRLGDRARNGPLGTGDRADVLALIAEVREHRAAAEKRRRYQERIWR